MRKNEVTVQCLANKLNISCNDVELLLNGSTPIDFNMAKKMEDVLHVTYKMFL